MSWRRRVVRSTLLVGVAVLCIRPVLTKTVGNRLSEQLQTPVSVGSTTLSFPHGTVYLENLRIDDSQCPLVAEDVALKLSSHEILFRNCIVDSLVGKGIRWTLPNLNREVDWSNSIVGNQANVNETLEEIRSILAKAEKALYDSERLSQERTHDINRRLSSLRHRMTEVTHKSQFVNPLRSSTLISQLRSEILATQKSLAEDRVKAKEEESIIQKSTDQSAELLTRAESAPISSRFQSEPLTDRILEQAMEIALRKTEPYVLAAEVGYSRFLGQIPSNATGKSVLPVSTSGRDLVIPSLAKRQLKLLRARLEGESVLGETRQPVEIVVTPVRIRHSDRNSLQIKWKPTDLCETTCQIGPVVSVESDDVHQMTLEVHIGESLIQRQSMFQGETRLSSLKSDMGSLLPQLQGFDESLLNALQQEVAKKSGTLLVATRSSKIADSSGIDPEAWTVNEQARAAIVACVAAAIENLDRTQQESNLQACRTELKYRKSLLESRRAALESLQRQKQEEWAEVLANLESQIDDIESSSRSALSRSTLTR